MGVVGKVTHKLPINLQIRRNSNENIREPVSISSLGSPSQEGLFIAGGKHLSAW
jgi:hypothetical protein